MDFPYTISVVPKPVMQEITKAQLSMPTFSLHATQDVVYVTLMTADNKVIDRKAVDIPPDVYTAWGQDDSFIVGYVLEQLDLEADHIDGAGPSSTGS